MFKPTCMAALFLTTLCAKVDAAVLFVDATNLRSQNGMVWRNDYFVGEDGGLEWRSVLEFDLSGISDAIISANLELVRYNFASSASAETLNVFDSTTSPSSPAMGSSFGDLGSGTAYGTASISSAGAPGDLVNIPLNPSALSDLNAALGNPFFLGLASGSLNGSLSGGKDGFFEASSAAGIQRLETRVQQGETE